MEKHINGIDIKVEGARIAGGAGIVTIWGMTASDIAAYATAVYMLIQIVLLMPKLIGMIKGWFRDD